METGSTANTAGAEARHIFDWRDVEAGVLDFALRRNRIAYEEVEWIWKIDQHQPWIHFAMGSTVEYVENRLQYSERQAHDHVKVARALSRSPLTAQQMKDGNLSWSQVRAMLPILQTEKHIEEEWLKALAGMTVRETETRVAGYERGMRPSDEADENIKTKSLHFDDIPAANWVLMKDMLRNVIRESRETGEEMSYGEALMDIFMRAMSDDRRLPHIRLSVMQNETTSRAWVMDGKTKIPIDPRFVWGASAELIGNVSTGATPESRTRTIPARMEALVRERAGHCCEVRGCRRRSNLQCHHIVPWAENGETTADNLILLCWFHHQRRHEGRLRIDGNYQTGVTFTYPDLGRTPYGDPAETKSLMRNTVAFRWLTKEAGVRESWAFAALEEVGREHPDASAELRLKLALEKIDLWRRTKRAVPHAGKDANETDDGIHEGVIGELAVLGLSREVTAPEVARILAETPGLSRDEVLRRAVDALAGRNSVMARETPAVYASPRGELTAPPARRRTGASGDRSHRGAPAAPGAAHPDSPPYMQ